MKKQLYLITTDFPYGNGEGSFILPELPYLQEKFYITVISNSLSSEQTVELPEDIKIVHYGRTASFLQKVVDSICYFFDMDAYQEIKEILKAKKKILGRLFESILFYEEARRFKRYLLKNQVIPADSPAVIYCYWYDYYCYTMTSLFKKNADIKIVTRTHRYDLYDEATNFGRQPFKRQMEKRLDQIVFIAEHGRKYYSEKYAKGNRLDKYQLFYLGVKPVQARMLEKKTNEFNIVSCSLVNARKRVSLIIDALNNIGDFKVYWIHFGDGPDFEDLKRYAAEKLDNHPNIQYSLKGYVQSEEVVKYYNENYFDTFITTSASEGCPVSIQEAMSCGIPIIGTAVAEIPNMISGNGILISENPTVEEITEAIRKMHDMCENEIQMMRKKSYELWQQKFNSEVNSRKFVEFLQNL